MPNGLTFTVAGMTPAPMGSKRHVGHGRLIESSKHVKPWRLLVQQAALATNHPTITTPVSLSIAFLFPRPKSHYTSKGLLKPTAPLFHAVRPDGSKLLRSTEDALVDAKLLHDDSLIAIGTFTKRYCRDDERPGAILTIISLSAT